MISIVCVFNEPRVLEERLLRSLGEQASEHEVITVDNQTNRFDGASKALNWGASQARGEWILFVHQDISLLTNEWLARAEALVREDGGGGWYGVAGGTREGRLRGIIRDRSALIGAPFESPLEVQTLDECVLIHRREAENNYQYFDEAVPGWHAYGVEACCAAIRAGQRNYVLPLPVWHDSKLDDVSSVLPDLKVSHEYVWHKHGAELKTIVTTCGILPDTHGWGASNLRALPRRARRLITRYGYRARGYERAFERRLSEALETLTRDEFVVECLHERAWFGRLETESFEAHTQNARRVLHEFRGWDAGRLESDCVVVASDLARTLDDKLEPLRTLRQSARRLLLYLDLSELEGRPELQAALTKDAAARPLLTLQGDGTQTMVLELKTR